MLVRNFHHRIVHCQLENVVLFSGETRHAVVGRPHALHKTMDARVVAWAEDQPKLVPIGRLHSLISRSVIPLKRGKHVKSTTLNRPDTADAAALAEHSKRATKYAFVPVCICFCFSYLSRLRRTNARASSWRKAGKERGDGEPRRQWYCLVGYRGEANPELEQEKNKETENIQLNTKENKKHKNKRRRRRRRRRR